MAKWITVQKMLLCRRKWEKFCSRRHQLGLLQKVAVNFFATSKLWEKENRKKGLVPLGDDNKLYSELCWIFKKTFSQGLWDCTPRKSITQRAEDAFILWATQGFRDRCLSSSCKQIMQLHGTVHAPSCRLGSKVNCASCFKRRTICCT